MIKTRFGETLAQVPNILQVTSFETITRRLHHISDYPSFQKLHSTLPSAVLSALKVRIRAGEPKAVQELWDKKDKTFLAIDFEWSERNDQICLEWGYAAERCGHLDALGHWPPNPDTSYRKGHYIIGEYVDKVVNKHCPTFPWHYAFGESQIAPKAKLQQIIQAVISSLASPDSETTPNTLVLVAHGIGGDLARLEEMNIRLPNNILTIDTSAYERMLHSSGQRGLMSDPKTGNPRVPVSTLSLENMLRTFNTSPQSTLPPSSSSVGSSCGIPTSTSATIATHILPNVRMHNAGNDALLCLFALQMLLEPVGTKLPTPVLKERAGMAVRPHSNHSSSGYMSPSPSMTVFSGFTTIVSSGPPYDLEGEFAAIAMNDDGGEDSDVGAGSGSVRPRQTARRSRPWAGVNGGRSSGGMDNNRVEYVGSNGTGSTRGKQTARRSRPWVGTYGGR